MEEQRKALGISVMGAQYRVVVVAGSRPWWRRWLGRRS